MNKTRSRRIVVLAGARQTGKTTLTLKIIMSNKEKVLIYDINNEEKYRQFPTVDLNGIAKIQGGIQRVITSDFDSVLKIIDRSFRNGLIVLEDANFYLTPARNEALWHLLVSCRHKGVDIVLTFHSLARIPPYVYEMMNTLILFKTSENIERIKAKIPNYELIERERVRAMNAPSRYYYKMITLI